MGIVYQAWQYSLKRPVALKMILTGLHADSTARLRFRTEAEAVARLQHPNIVQIHEVSEHGGRPFLSLEYVEGGNLLGKIAGTAQPEREAARLVETLARAVHYTHQRGILHRDLKPNNVLLTADGTPKITDFGLAKILDVDGGPTRTATMLGTPSYMAPEQAAGDATKVGTLADVYSLGAILYELLTGRVPFQGRTPLLTLEQVRHQEPVPPRHWRRSVSPDLEAICLKCLEKKPDQRYSSAAALADDLKCFLAGQSIQARPIPVWRRLWRSARRRPALVAWALGIVAGVCLLLTSWSYWQTADLLAPHQAVEKHKQFVQGRDKAFLYGLLTPDQGALFLGAERAAILQTAEVSAREALALAGVDPELENAALASGFPASRQSEITADCYALLLVLASVRDQGGPERSREALRLLDRARLLGLQTQAYHVRRAHFLEREGKAEEARKARSQAAARAPAGAFDYFLIGEEHYRRGQWEQAGRSFNQTLSLQPGHFWSQFFLAVCYMKGQHWEAARAGFNACLSQQPDFVWAYLFRSMANEKLQALAEAQADFQKALQLNLNEEARYVLLISRGILHFNQRDWEPAAADFRSALSLKPEQYHAYLNLAQVYIAQGRLQEAAELEKTAQRWHPPIPVLVAYHLECGRQLLGDKKYAAADRACTAALKLAPEQPLAHEVRGRAMLALERYDQAAGSFDQYLGHGGEKKSDIFRGRGLARMKLGKYPEAAEDYTRALDLAPADAVLYQHRGWAHFFADAWKLALRDFSKALELAPEAGDAYTGRGLAQVMLGHYLEAVGDAEAALRRRPRTPEMMHNLACIFAQASARAEGDRSALADGYRRRALEAVHQTLGLLRQEERPAFWQDKILPDAALTPIRNLAEFQRLQDEYVRRR